MTPKQTKTTKHRKSGGGRQVQRRISLPQKITIETERGRLDIEPQLYIKAKCGDLREFGYGNLTEKEVEQQLLKILNHEKLDIIGMFMEKDIVAS